MTIKTRRRLFFSLLVLALTLPAETILLKALQSPIDRVAVREWVAALSATELAVSAEKIQSYPFTYRREIMARLSPMLRSAVWRGHIEDYLEQHANLDAATVTALQAAQSALTPRALSEPTTDDRAAVDAVAEQLVALVGMDDTIYLLERMGPTDAKLAGAEAVITQLASMVRRQFVVSARNWDCECSQGGGCYGYGGFCSGEDYCQWDVQWPMCGFAWMDVCDGMCRVW